MQLNKETKQNQLNGTLHSSLLFYYKIGSPVIPGEGGLYIYI